MLKRTSLLAGCAAFGIFCGLYAAWPYWSAYELRSALETADVALLNRKVVWSSVRASVKEMLAAEMMRDLVKKGLGKTDGEVLGTGLAAVLAPAMMDRMVDSMITPYGLATFIRSNAGGRFVISDDAIRRVGFASPTRFEIEIGPPGDDKRLLGVLELTDFDWKLTQLIMLGPLGGR